MSSAQKSQQEYSVYNPVIKQSTGVSNNFVSYAEYNTRIPGTHQYIDKDGALSTSQNRVLYRDNKNFLVNKKSQDISKNYVSPYSQRLDITRRNQETNSKSRTREESKEKLGPDGKPLYFYEELYSQRPSYTVKSRHQVYTPGRKHIHEHTDLSPDGRALVTTTTTYEEPVIHETLILDNPYPETKYYQRMTKASAQNEEGEIPGRRLYEKLPLDVRERNQTRIPSPGHKVTYDPVFGLAGDIVKRPPGNMEDWLKRSYARQTGNDNLDQFDFVPEFREELDLTPIPTEEIVHTVELIEPCNEEFYGDMNDENVDDDVNDQGNISFGDNSINNTGEIANDENSHKTIEIDQPQRQFVIPDLYKPDSDVNFSSNKSALSQLQPEPEQNLVDESNLKQPYSPNNYDTYGMEPIVNSRRLHSPAQSRSPSPARDTTQLLSPPKELKKAASPPRESLKSASPAREKTLEGYGKPSKDYDPNLQAFKPPGDRNAFADKLRDQLGKINTKVLPKKHDEDQRGKKFNQGQKLVDGLNKARDSSQAPLAPVQNIFKPQKPEKSGLKNKKAKKPSGLGTENDRDKNPAENSILYPPTSKTSYNDKLNLNSNSGLTNPGNDGSKNNGDEVRNLQRLRDQLKESNLRQNEKPASSNRKPKIDDKVNKNSPSNFELSNKTLGYDSWAPRQRSKDKVDWDKHGLQAVKNPNTREKKSPKAPRESDWDNSLNKGHLLGPSPEPLHILPEIYQRKKEVDPKTYKDGASYKIPEFERKYYDVESPVRAYIHSPSPPRKVRPEQNANDQDKRGLSPTTKYYLSLSTRKNQEELPEKEPETYKTSFKMTSTLKKVMNTIEKNKNENIDTYLSNNKYQVEEDEDQELEPHPENSTDKNLKLMMMNALKSKLSIIEGYEEDTAELTNAQIYQIVYNEKLQGKIVEKTTNQTMDNFKFYKNEEPKDTKEKIILAQSLKKTKESGQSKHFNSTGHKNTGSGKFSNTVVSGFDPNEKEIIKKKMIDRILRSREPPRQTKILTRQDAEKGKNRSKTPSRNH